MLVGESVLEGVKDVVEGFDRRGRDGQDVNRASVGQLVVCERKTGFDGREVVKERREETAQPQSQSSSGKHICFLFTDGIENGERELALGLVRSGPGYSHS